jgi:hypothetical protein
MKSPVVAAPSARCAVRARLLSAALSAVAALACVPGSAAAPCFDPGNAPSSLPLAGGSTTSWMMQHEEVARSNSPLMGVAEELALNVQEELEPSDCYPDCDGNGRLDIFDMLCFLNHHAAQDPYANCNEDQTWDIFDFLCFVNEFNAGC